MPPTTSEEDSRAGDGQGSGEPAGTGPLPEGAPGLGPHWRSGSGAHVNAPDLKGLQTAQWFLRHLERSPQARECLDFSSTHRPGVQATAFSPGSCSGNGAFLVFCFFPLQVLREVSDLEGSWCPLGRAGGLNDHRVPPRNSPCVTQSGCLLHVSARWLLWWTVRVRSPPDTP